MTSDLPLCAYAESRWKDAGLLGNTSYSVQHMLRHYQLLAVDYHIRAPPLHLPVPR